MIYFYHVIGDKANFFSVSSLCHDQQCKVTTSIAFGKYDYLYRNNSE